MTRLNFSLKINKNVKKKLRKKKKIILLFVNFCNTILYAVLFQNFSVYSKIFIKKVIIHNFLIMQNLYNLF